METQKRDNKGRFAKKNNRALLRINVMRVTNKEKELIEQMREGEDGKETGYLVYISQEDFD